MCCSTSTSRRVNSGGGGGGGTTAEGSPSLFFPSPLTNERQTIQPNFKWTLLLYKLGLLGQFCTARQPKTPTAEPQHACLPFAQQPWPSAENSRNPVDETRERPQRILHRPPVTRLSHAEPRRGIERGSLAQCMARSVAPPQPLSPPQSAHPTAATGKPFTTALTSTCSRAAGYQCPRTPGPGESRLFPGHLRIVPLIFWKL